MQTAPASESSTVQSLELMFPPLTPSSDPTNKHESLVTVPNEFCPLYCLFVLSWLGDRIQDFMTSLPNSPPLPDGYTRRAYLQWLGRSMISFPLTRLASLDAEDMIPMIKQLPASAQPIVVALKPFEAFAAQPPEQEQLSLLALSYPTIVHDTYRLRDFARGGSSYLPVIFNTNLTGGIDSSGNGENHWVLFVLSKEADLGYDSLQSTVVLEKMYPVLKRLVALYAGSLH